MRLAPGAGSSDCPRSSLWSHISHGMFRIPSATLRTACPFVTSKLHLRNWLSRLTIEAETTPRIKLNADKIQELSFRTLAGFATGRRAPATTAPNRGAFASYPQAGFAPSP
jgi:hypothetical protein